LLEALIPLIEKEVKDALSKQGIPADVSTVGREMTIILKKDDIVKAVKEQIPPPYNQNVEVEASDIIVRVKL